MAWFEARFGSVGQLLLATDVQIQIVIGLGLALGLARFGSVGPLPLSAGCPDTDSDWPRFGDRFASVWPSSAWRMASADRLWAGFRG